jgi:hypothetical protein
MNKSVALNELKSRFRFRNALLLILCLLVSTIWDDALGYKYQGSDIVGLLHSLGMICVGYSLGVLAGFYYKTVRVMEQSELSVPLAKPAEPSLPSVKLKVVFPMVRAMDEVRRLGLHIVTMLQSIELVAPGPDAKQTVENLIELAVSDMVELLRNPTLDDDQLAVLFRDLGSDLYIRHRKDSRTFLERMVRKHHTNPHGQYYGLMIGRVQGILDIAGWEPID